MKRILLFFLFLCLSLNLLSAAEHLFQIRGRIIDKQTREPVSFANVILETDPTKGSATDEKGDFSITEVKNMIQKWCIESCIGLENNQSYFFFLCAGDTNTTWKCYQNTIRNICMMTIFCFCYDIYLILNDVV